MSTENGTYLKFSSRLHALPEIDISLNGNDATSAQAKKRARKEISLQYTSEKIGFLHSVIIKIDQQHFLLAGPSGIGKSTYASHLNREHGVTLLAQDWVAIERDGNDFFVSDLNFNDSLKHFDRCLLSGIIFLTYNDSNKRDAFIPNDEEFLLLLRETFDTATGPELERLNQFWLVNQHSIPFYCAVPARCASEDYITKTLIHILHPSESTNQHHDVGVIGIGSVGAELAFQLGQLPFVNKVHMFNRTHKKTVGHALDMNHAVTNRDDDVYIPHSEAQNIFRHSSSVFLVFRDETAAPELEELPERWRKLPSHLLLTKQYAQIASDANFNGSVFLVTNPVDILTYAYHSYSQRMQNPARTFQVYGVGLEVDAARALFYGRKMHPTLTMNDITLYGNHTDDLALETPLSTEQNAILLHAVQGASGEVRRYLPRTVYGPVGSAIRTFRSFIEESDAHATVLLKDAFIGRRVRFRHRLPMLAINPRNDEYNKILKNNQQMIAKFRHLL